MAKKKIKPVEDQIYVMDNRPPLRVHDGKVQHYFMNAWMESSFTIKEFTGFLNDGSYTALDTAAMFRPEGSGDSWTVHQGDKSNAAASFRGPNAVWRAKEESIRLNREAGYPASNSSP
jgi:hypothetical protein